MVATPFNSPPRCYHSSFSAYNPIQSSYYSSFHFIVHHPWAAFGPQSVYHQVILWPGSQTLAQSSKLQMKVPGPFGVRSGTQLTHQIFASLSRRCKCCLSLSTGLMYAYWSNFRLLPGICAASILGSSHTCYLTALTEAEWLACIDGSEYGAISRYVWPVGHSLFSFSTW